MVVLMVRLLVGVLGYLLEIYKVPKKELMLEHYSELYSEQLMGYLKEISMALKMAVMMDD